MVAASAVEFIHVGRHVRIPEDALEEFIDAGIVEPVRTRYRTGRARSVPLGLDVSVPSALVIVPTRSEGYRHIHNVNED